MIHIATVHWRTDKWIDIQLQYLQKYIKEDFQVYAFLNGVKKKHAKKFYYSSQEEINEHDIKLNILADIIQFSSGNEEDIIMFLDGDAFPIANIIDFAHDKLEKYPLLAIQRRENHLGGLLPHPSFCITTIKFWKSINGNWGKAYIGKFLGKKIHEVGGHLEEILQNNKQIWYPMLRSNIKNIHPLWYGIYDDVIYHHGAGFRMPTSRIDKNNLDKLIKIYFSLINKFPDRFFNILNPTKHLFRKESLQSESIYNAIIKNPEFFKYFQGQTLAPDNSII